MGSTIFVYTMRDNLMSEPQDPTSKEIDDYINTPKIQEGTGKL